MKTIILFLLIIPIHSFGEIGFFYRFKDVIKYKGKCDKILRYKKTKRDPFTMLIPNKKPLFERFSYNDFKNPEKHCKSLLFSRDKFKNYMYLQGLSRNMVTTAGLNSEVSKHKNNQENQ